MPTYNFRNKKTGEVWEDLMTIAEMEKLTKKRHIELLPPTQMNIVSSTGSMDSKTDAGWKETLSKVAEAHPMSALASEMGTKSTKQIKTQQVLKKHKARQSAKSK